MLTVITPATASNLTTVERARALLGFDQAADATVGILIEQASRVIADYCRRPFGVETVRETFDLCGRDGGVLLSRSPVTAFVEVKDGSDVYAAEGYQYAAETGALYRLSSDGSAYWWNWGASLSVTYTAGYVLPSDEENAPAATLPAPVERAAIRLVGAYLSLQGRDSLIKSETVEGIGSTTWWMQGGSGLADPEAGQLLSAYRRLF